MVSNCCTGSSSLKKRGLHGSLNGENTHAPGGDTFTGRGGSDAVTHTRRDSLGRMSPRSERSEVNSRCSCRGSDTTVPSCDSSAPCKPGTAAANSANDHRGGKCGGRRRQSKVSCNLVFVLIFRTFRTADRCRTHQVHEQSGISYYIGINYR